MADVRIRPDEGVPERESKAERRLRKEAERLADSRPLEYLASYVLLSRYFFAYAIPALQC